MTQSLNTFLLLSFLLDPYSPDAVLKEKLGELDQQDWSDLAKLALQQGVSLRFYQTIGGSSKPMVFPAELHAQLKNAYLRNAVRNTLILHYAAQLLSNLRDHKIETIGLKGIYLIENINRSIAERSFGDIDLLVKRNDLSSAMECVRACGFHPSSYFEPADQDTDIKHVPPMINNDGLPVEIHWTLLEEDEPFSIDIEGLWKRAQPVTMAGVNCLCLSQEDLLAHLCLHLTYQHHLCLGLKGILDVVDALWHFHDKLDWRLFLSIVQTWQCQRVAWLTFSLIQEFSAARIPPEVMKALQPAGVEPWIIDQARSQIIAANFNWDEVTPDLANYSEAKGFFSKLKIGFGRVFLPRRVIARLYDLRPNSLEILRGYFLRVMDLSRGYGKRVWHPEPEASAWKNSVAKEQERMKLRAWLGKVG